MTNLNAAIFSKYLLAPESYELGILSNEESALKVQLALVKSEERNLSGVLSPSRAGESETPFVEMALVELQSRRKKLLSLASGSIKERPGTGNKDSDGFFYTALPQVPSASKHKESTSPLDSKAASDENVSFYFYTASSGQHFYLHPLDIRIMKHEYREYELFPSELSLPVLGISDSTMDAELRKRCKYLSHLPLSCDVSFCEVAWTADLLSPETLQVFERQLAERKQRRKEKETKESLLSAKKACEPWLVYPEGFSAPSSPFDSPDGVVTFTESDFPVAQSAALAGMPVSPSTKSHSQPKSDFSFASIATNKNLSFSQTRQQDAYLKGSARARQQRRAGADYDEEDEEYYVFGEGEDSSFVKEPQGWTLDLDDLVVSSGQSNASGQNGQNKNKGKKSAGKARVLMSNGGARRQR